MKNKTMRTGQNDTRNVKWTLHRLSKLIENQKKLLALRLSLVQRFDNRRANFKQQKNKFL